MKGEADEEIIHFHLSDGTQPRSSRRDSLRAGGAGRETEPLMAAMGRRRRREFGRAFHRALLCLGGKEGRVERDSGLHLDFCPHGLA